MDNRRQQMSVYRAVSYALAFVGTRYYWTDVKDRPSAGNDDPVLGFDCSGLASEVCRAVGWIGGYERLSSAQFLDRFPIIEGPPEAGDLLIFGNRATGEAYHTAIVVDHYHMIEAGGGYKGVDTDQEAAEQNAFVRIRPIEWRESERLAAVRPRNTQQGNIDVGAIR
jgi:cell wall-associated NlpC family hydrolase